VLNLHPMGMIFGLLLAKQRNVEDPLMPALVSGMLPMPMGIVASLLLIDKQSNGSTSTNIASTSVPIPNQQIQDAIKAYDRAVNANTVDLAAVAAAAQKLIKLRVAIGSLPESVRGKALTDPDLLTELQKRIDGMADGFRTLTPTDVPTPPPTPTPMDPPIPNA
jgi:hypothetical protein